MDLVIMTVCDFFLDNKTLSDIAYKYIELNRLFITKSSNNYINLLKIKFIYVEDCFCIEKT